jgi:hypothetical protein
MPPGENVIGKVTAVSGNTLTVAPMTGGNPVTVKIGDDTRIRKDRQPAKAADIKVDDMVFARGTLTGTIMDAAIIGLVNPEMVQRMQQGGAGQFNREDLGKKFIVGEVKAINELKLTIARPDNQTQEIEVDENTSFHKGRESVTLADIKVGDFVRGSGELKNGVFMPKELIVGPPGIVMGLGGPRGQGGARMDPDAMGKTFIAGRATTVSGNKITVMRNDGQSQEITIDSATSLRLMPGNAGITLADIKAGDRVRGPGELKNGVFVPRELVVNHPRDNEAPGGEKPQLPASPKN